MFNPDELVLEKIRSVEEYNIETGEIEGVYRQIEDPSLKVSAEATDVLDAVGAKIQSFYHAQNGSFSFTNSLFSLGLAASQFGSEKEIADESHKILVPVSEIIPVGADHTVVLKYVPVGTVGAEIKFVKVINDNNTFGKKYEISATAGAGKFTLNAETKTITMPDDVTGNVFVNYVKESANTVKIEKNTDGIPAVKKLVANVIFHDPCNTNLIYSGVIVCPRAQIDPSSIEIGLKPDSKHPVSYNLNKDYCSKDGKLFDIIVDKD